MAAKIKLEKITVDQAEEASKIAKLKCTLLAAESAVETSTGRNSMVTMQIAEMENERHEVQDKLIWKNENESNTMEPQLIAWRQKISELEREIETFKSMTAAKEKDFEIQKMQSNALEEQIRDNKLTCEQHEYETKKIANDPDRIRKQADKFEAAVNQLNQQIA